MGCKKFGAYLCPNCFATLSFATNPKCLVCNKPSFDGLTHSKCKKKDTIDGSIAALNYKGLIKKVLYQFKYSPYLTDLQTILGDLLYEELIQNELFMQILTTHPVVVPIPLSAAKLRKRGYNQSEVLAKNLGKRFQLPVVNVLKRIKETKPQYGLKKEERRVNMKGAFSFVIPTKTEIQTGSSIRSRMTAILVDDIVTTGSTLLEAAKILKKNGFEKVWGVVLAQD